jgi:hypothetical protein
MATEQQLTPLFQRLHLYILVGKAVLSEGILSTFSRELVRRDLTKFLNADDMVALGLDSVFTTAANAPGGLVVVNPQTGMIPPALYNGGGGGGGATIDKRTYTQNFFNITGFTGGGATNLDGIPTANAAAQVNWSVRLGDTYNSVWWLKAGTPGALASERVVPLDADPATNPVYWQRIE